MTYCEWKEIPKTDWRTEPISCTCQVALSYGKGTNGAIASVNECGNSTIKVYPTARLGWMSLCAYHAKKHPEAFDVYEVIASGEKWA